ncbi:hypothetical protein RN001_005707 [Aquatica leii]|uniref:Putative nuclease HARBI1 n=1 Tax=Aquatica leii TaxID=1421715 RepID=A0AAN7SPY0_9COLE|nr:hypothetical protein RN001_005707 [Aquatica leii]
MEDLINVDEEIEEVQMIQDVLNINRNPKVYVDHMNPLVYYSDDQFRQYYRLKKPTAENIINIVRHQLNHLNNRGRPVSPEIQVLAFIRYCAKGADQNEISEKHGFHQTTLSRIIKRVAVALSYHRDEYIKFPTPAQLNIVKQDFYAIAGCPNIVGCIYGTHVKIKCQTVDYPLLYIDRKGHYSINVQVVSDAKCRILDIVARWRDSVHDSRIWNECNLKAKFDNGEINGILLGDNGYASSRYLLTPVLNPTTPSEERYNRAHIRTRNVVERLFGYMKNKFRCFFNTIKVDLETTKAVIIALSIIYNIYIEEKLSNNEDMSDNSDDEENQAIAPLREVANIQGNIFRQNYINRHFNR